MSYIDKNLLSNENIIFRTKKHYIIFAKPLALAVLALAFFLIKNETHLLDSYMSILGNMAFLLSIFAGVLFIAAGLSALRMFITYYMSDYAITTQRVIMREGLIIRRVSETRLQTISHVTVDQDLLGQVIDYGTIVVNGYGGVADSFTFIKSPLIFQSQVHNFLGKNR